MAQAGYTPISLYYSTTAAAVPLAANLAQGELAINIADGKLYYENSSGVVTLLASSTTVTNSFSAGTTGFTPSTATTGAVTLGGTLITSNGGTGLASYTAGDLSYYASGTALTKLAIGTAGQILTSSGTAPQWSTLSGVAVTTFSAGTTGFTPSSATAGAVTLAGTLATTNGGTGLTSFTSGGVVYASSTSALATGSAFNFNGTKVSIGTTEANRGLNVYELNNTANSTTSFWNLDYAGLFVRNTSTTTNTLAGIGFSGGTIGNSASGIANILESVNAGALGFYTGGASASNTVPERMRIASDGSVGIGTSSPSSKLDVSGVISLQGTTLPTAGTARFFSRSSDSSFYIQTATSGSLYLLDGSQNTMYAARSTSHEWATNNTTKMTLDSAGNLGLGVTPSAWDTLTAFQIKNGSVYGYSTGDVSIGVNNYYGTSSFRYITSSVAAGKYTISGNEHVWYSAPSGTAGNAITFTQAMTLDASGNLGIGTTSVNPTGLAILSGGQGKGVLVARNVSGGANPTSGQSLGSYAFKGIMDGVNSNGSSEAMIEAIAAENQTGSTAATSMLFYTKSSGTGPGSAPTKRATLTSVGNLGVGNFAPYDTWGNSYVAVQINSVTRSLAATGAGAGDLTLAFNAVYDSTDSRWEYASTGDKAGRYSQTGGTNAHVWYVTDTNGTAGNAIAFTQAFTLQSDGTFLLNTTSATGNATGSSVNPGIVIGTGTITSQANGNSNHYWSKATGYTSGDFSAHYVNGAYVGGISTNGSTTTYATASDYRLKENVQPMTGALAKVAQLKPVTYTWKSSGQSTQGFIAHELQSIVPDCVVGEKDALNADGSIKPQSVDTSFLVATLTAAIQEQQAIIESLKARLDAANL